MSVIGVGIDTARYGHVASFVREDRSPAAAPLEFRESCEGYEQLSKRLESLVRGDDSVGFLIHIDAGGQYASNLEAFLRGLSLRMTISVGEPTRNKNYHRALSPKVKTDKSESWAMARFAVAERPNPSPSRSAESLALLEAVRQLHSRSKELTRHLNQLHNLLSRAFPELAAHVPNLGALRVLLVLKKWPTAEKLARARLESIKAIPYMKPELAHKLHEAAKRSVACLKGEIAEQLVLAAVQKVEQCQKAKTKCEELAIKAYRDLPECGQQHLTSIPGIGEITAAVITAKVGSISRFETEEKLVSYFGVFPERRSSGFTKDGQPRETKMRMSRKGCDLVRAYLWNAAKAAIRCNPPVRNLYCRKVDESKAGGVALGHCMRKLVQQVFHIWTTEQPFKCPAENEDTPTSQETADQHSEGESRTQTTGQTKTAAGLKVVNATNRKEVTAASSRLPSQPKDARPRIDYAHLRSQFTFAQVLDSLNLRSTLRHSAGELRGPCPIHGSRSPRSRSLAINLDKDTFYCHARDCKAGGNALDFWTQYHGLPLYDAALKLAEDLGLELTRTEKRSPSLPSKKAGDITPDPH
jgi:transposase